MRYEAMRLLQFLFSLTLIVGAFAAGVLAGWWRWAPRRGRSEEDTPEEDPTTPAAADGPATAEAPRAGDVGPLFSPEGRGWGGRSSSVPRSRTVVLPAGADPRRRGALARGELPRGGRVDEPVIDLRDTTIAGEHPSSRPPDF